MVIGDEAKAKEILLDIGYYRLGYYWFPFEKSYPRYEERTHVFSADTRIDDAVKLYYFDFNLRSLLLKYISRIEIKFKTLLTYYVSNAYPDSSTWFVDTNVVNSDFAQDFDSKVYTIELKSNRPIALHHKHHPQDKYAPVWKTIEYMTLGSTIVMYKALLDLSLKTMIAQKMGVKYIEVFQNYINVVKDIRNCCAHGNVIFDFKPKSSIRKGPGCHIPYGNNQNLNGAIQVVLYLLGTISKNRQHDMEEGIIALLKQYGVSAKVRSVLQEESGFKHWNIYERTFFP